MAPKDELFWFLFTTDRKASKTHKPWLKAMMRIRLSSELTYVPEISPCNIEKYLTFVTTLSFDFRYL